MRCANPQQLMARTRNANLCILLFSATVSLQGCGGCDKKAAAKCQHNVETNEELDFSDSCSFLQASFDCFKSCCNEKAEDMFWKCDERCDKQFKDIMRDAAQNCVDLENPCKRY
eukprot:gnl/TRDRNA2_/TRDRNA2_207728_c0_seq1.p1 gnl/TRDRNA2_/TRDRNA2_207728_c0~~gnl/TRDRNA2_/TRDRNA2_207728_c0_seq1.p1  ORF type:complete len:114 (+),score=17.74 gnl/TRDRNA2_/TRDRNA2_207728_c0_seq1:109-450(+)